MVSKANSYLELLFEQEVAGRCENCGHYQPEVGTFSSENVAKLIKWSILTK